MNVLPIQVTDEAVLIPHHYLHGADEFEIEVVDGYVVLRPKVKQGKDADGLLPSKSKRFSFAGIAVSSNPNASEEVEEILARELGVPNVEKVAKP